MAAVAYDSAHPAVLQTLEGQPTSHSHSHSSEEGDHEPKTPTTASTTNDNETAEKHIGSTTGETDETRSFEAEQSIGVTKIEALYIVFGKGWKLALLWVYVPSPLSLISKPRSVC